MNYTDDEDEVRDLLNDLELEREAVVSALHRISTSDAAGGNLRARAASLLVHLEKTWPKRNVDDMRDDLNEQAEKREAEELADARDEASRLSAEVDEEIRGLR